MKNSKEATSALYIDIPQALHKRLKVLAAARGKSLKKLVIEALDVIDNECKFHSHIPNEETEKAIRESYDKKNHIKSKDIEDFFKKLGI